MAKTKVPTIDPVTELFNSLGVVRASQVAPPSFMRSGFSRIDNCRQEPGHTGYMRGAAVIIYGPTGVGKSTDVYQTVAYDQQQNPDGLWLVCNIENSYDAAWSKTLGVDLDRLGILPIQDFLEGSLEKARQAIATGKFRGVVVDSIHAQAVNRETGGGEKKERSLEDENAVGAMPLKMTQFIKTIKVDMIRTNTVVILIGQARDNMDKYGDKVKLTGGNALKHEADLILQLTSSTSATACEGIIPKNADGQFDGHMTTVKVEKCRGRGMGRRFNIPFIKGRGFSEERCLVEECTRTTWGQELLQAKGNWYYWKDANGEEQKINGKNALLDYFMGSPNELIRLQELVVTAEDTDGQPAEVVQTSTTE